MSNHPIVHVELSSNDTVASAKFYHDLFGWEAQQIPEMHYATFSTGEGSLAGGYNPVTPENPPGKVLLYVGTHDIKASIAKVEQLGGKVISPTMPIPGVGLFALFKDLTGNEIGLLEEHEDQK
ncbi:MAG TPA: VOC family protein [Anaerolineaceae bacterium]